MVGEVKDIRFLFDIGVRIIEFVIIFKFFYCMYIFFLVIIYERKKMFFKYVIVIRYLRLKYFLFF